MSMLLVIVHLSLTHWWPHCRWWQGDDSMTFGGTLVLGMAPNSVKAPALVHLLRGTDSSTSTDHILLNFGLLAIDPSHKHWWLHWWHSAELWPWAWPQTMSSKRCKTSAPSRAMNSWSLFPLCCTVYFKRRLNALGFPFHQRPIPGAPWQKRQLNPRSPA